MATNPSKDHNKSFPASPYTSATGVDSVGRRLATQRALQVGVKREYLWIVPIGDWCTAMLLKDPAVIKVSSRAELEIAASSPDIKTILVTRPSPLSPDAVNAVLSRSKLQKTVFCLE